MARTPQGLSLEKTPAKWLYIGRMEGNMRLSPMEGSIYSGGRCHGAFARISFHPLRRNAVKWSESVKELKEIPTRIAATLYIAVAALMLSFVALIVAVNHGGH